ncbi:MAG: SDR family oxidoreductase [Proteobacteria bacterium]|nr:SDR family oxidoreductase [Pseudomonadota bacterium]MBU1451350.1 SDR family oxidoreductase [Pseudomonadota bacterium]MBU2469529.1 SDR family oxidoreductase [Pseudomonadota bacterium]MBU2518386.1 SDR family oxidoreductase [Pseudomonadota bacterium]
MDINEPAITSDEILLLSDPEFHHGHVCIVTGAAGGIGRATAVAAAANNIMTVGLDINQEGGEETQRLAREVGGQMIFIKTDLTKDADMDYAVAEAAKLGQIRYLVNIAGMQHIDFIEDFPMDKYDYMQRLNLRSAVYLSRLCIPHFKNSPDGRGVVGNMASAHAHISTLAKVSYNISKFGLRALAQSISAEGAGLIRAFSVSTAFVKTALTLNQIPAQAQKRGISPEEVVTGVMCGETRIKELMNPIEVGNLFIFGMSRFSRFLVGGDLLFDGGMVLTYAEKKN